MPEITLTYDYLCPFARIANEAAVEMVEETDTHKFRFAPFSLHQNGLEPGTDAVWDDGEGISGRGVRALLWSLAVRDGYPEAFAAFHVGVFSARHDQGADINDTAVLAAIAEEAGLDAGAVAAAVDSGVPMKTLKAEHQSLVDDYAVFGVPTFISGGEAVFVRMMERHRSDDLRRIVDMLTWTNVNEFKRTRVPR